MKRLIIVTLLLLSSCDRAAEPTGTAPSKSPQAESASPTSTSSPAIALAPTPTSAPTPATGPAVIVLHARDVTIHGKTVRYEPEPHKNTIGYWSDVADWVSWEFDVPAPGTYAVQVLQGCGEGSGGSEVEITVAAIPREEEAPGDGAPRAPEPDQRLTFTVEDTGHFQKFVARTVGSVMFGAPGRYTLSVKPLSKPGVAVMDLRQVTLTPAAAE